MSAETVALLVAPAPAGEPCSTGCGRPAVMQVAALHDGSAGYAYACALHPYDAEVEALRHLADRLELALVERRRSQSSRTVGARP